MNKEERVFKETDIAVIGISGRFPEAENRDLFWNNLLKGRESVTRKETKGKTLVNAAGLLEDAYCFDNEFFDINDSDALNMDPQYRAILETAYSALEDAGYGGEDGDRSIGLFLGADETFYVWNNFYNKLLRNEPVNRIGMFLENTLTCRISYKLNLTGPSVAVTASCATSNVAVHYAIQSLLNYDCNMALAGGVNIKVLEEGYQAVEGMSSAYGQLRAYDAAGDGFVPGNGMGILAVKRLEDAIADRDNIYAVISGSSVVNDGNRKAGYHASSVDGEAEAIMKAMVMAERSPADISCIEGHGTATPLGDSVEIRAIDKAYRGISDDDYFCALGSVKTNVGHLNTAAGVAGLIKGILTVKNGVFPPSLNYEVPNPELVKVEKNLFVNTEPYRLPEDKMRIVGVSSFGFGGIDSHIVVEEAPERDKIVNNRKYYLLPVSGKTHQAAERNLDNIREFLKINNSEISEVSYTLWSGRDHMDYRGWVITDSSGAVLGEQKIDKIHSVSGVSSDAVDEEYRKAEEIASAWMRGEDVNYMELFDRIPYKASLPAYSFEKRKFVVSEMSFSPGTSRYCIFDGLNDSNFQLTKHLSRQNRTALTLVEKRGGERKCSLVTDPESLREKFNIREKEILNENEVHLLHRNEAWIRAVDNICFLSVERYLSRYEIFRSAGEFTLNEAMNSLGIKEEFREFFIFLLNLIQKNGYVRREGERVAVVKPLVQSSRLDSAMEEFKRDIPFAYKLMKLIVHSTSHYEEAFTGKIPGNEVLYPGGSYELLQGIDRNGTTELLYCQLSAELIGELVENSRDTVNILEIGGGTGELTDKVLESVKGKKVKYWFTDIGSSFLALYRRKIEDKYDLDIEFIKLDITKDFKSQGIDDGSLDLVIGVNVMQATSAMGQVMSNCRKALVSGGYMMMVQLYKIHDLQELIFGLSPGWWNYREDEIERDKPYFSLEEWHQFYENCGFGNVSSYPELKDEDTSNAALLIGRNVAEESSERVDEISGSKMRRLELIRSGSAEVELEYIETLNDIDIADYSRTWREKNPTGEIINSYENENRGETGISEAGAGGIRSQLEGMITSILDMDEVEEDDFMEPFDSLSVLILCGEIQKVWNVEISAKTLYSLGSVDELAEYVENRSGAEAPETIVNSGEEGNIDLLFDE